MYLYKRKNGVFYIGQKLDGKVKWTTTKCRDKQSALSFLKDFDTTVSKPKDKPTISQFKNQLLETLKPTLRPATMWQYEYAMRLLIEHCGDIKLSDITSRHIEQLKIERLKVNKPTAVNVALKGLKACLNRAVKWELLDTNPCMRVDLCRITKAPPRFLSKDELDKLCSIVKEDIIRDIFIFAAHTGCRLSECINIRHHFVDLNNGVFTVASQWNFETKSGKSRQIPMNSVVKDIVKRQDRYKNTTYLFQKNGFPLKKDYVSQKFREYCDKAKLQRAYHFHSLRHSAISWWLMAGVDIFTVKEWAGHGDLQQISDVYGHLTENHKQDQMKKLDIWLNKQ